MADIEYLLGNAGHDLAHAMRFIYEQFLKNAMKYCMCWQYCTELDLSSVSHHLSGNLSEYYHLSVTSRETFVTWRRNTERYYVWFGIWCYLFFVLSCSCNKRNNLVTTIYFSQSCIRKYESCYERSYRIEGHVDVKSE